MTGPEHYLEAERLAAGAQNVMDVAPIDGLTREECATLAHVHATLALAAATAMGACHADGMAEDDFSEWDEACGFKADGGTDG